MQAAVDAQSLDLGGFRLRTTSPVLIRVAFSQVDHSGTSDDEPEDDQFDLTLRAQRSQKDAVIVELSAQSRDTGAAEFDVAFSVGIRVEPIADSSSANLETTLRTVAARIGPVILFPYVRELLASLSQRSGGPTIVLPVMNVGLVFDPSEVELRADKTEESSQA